MKKPWEIFSARKMYENFIGFCGLLRKARLNDVSLSFHPCMVLDSALIVYKDKFNGKDVTSIDCPDIVNFFDARMRNEFFRKQSIKEFIGRNIDHVGWRLMNVPSLHMWRQKVGYLVQNLVNLRLIKISSSSLSYLSSEVLDVVDWENSSIKIAVELDAFVHRDIESYINELEVFIKTNGLDKQIVGLSLDPGHILQGYVSGKWGDAYEFVSKTIDNGWKIFCLDIDPVEILDKERYQRRDVEDIEEEVEKVVKIHGKFDNNVIDYVSLIKDLKEKQRDINLELCIEVNPRDREDLIKNPKFIEEMKKIKELL